MAINNLVYIDDKGYHYADYPSFLSYLQDEYKTIYGSDIYLEADSQDGQWLAIIALAFYDLAQVGSKIYSSYSPSTAQSDALSRNVKINGISRNIATYSQVDLYIVGQAGTTITNGQVSDSLNQIWILPTNVVIPESGDITVTATSAQIGSVEAAANTITEIKTPTRGWQSVTNILPATSGSPVETDSELRRRQSVSTALPSLSVLDGTIGAVASVAGVSSYRGYENDTNLTDSDGIPPHSISIVVEGGDAQEIANAIAIKKTPGTGTFGTTSVMTYDKYGTPNQINFFRPTPAVIGVKITIDALQGYTSSFETLIKQAVAESINSLSIGDDVLITKLYVPANLPTNPAGNTFDITDLQIQKNGGGFGSTNIAIAFNEKAESDPEVNIEVIVT